MVKVEDLVQHWKTTFTFKSPPPPTCPQTTVLMEPYPRWHATLYNKLFLALGWHGPNDKSFKVTVKLRIFADLDFDLDPNWGITPKIETLYNLSRLPDTKNPKNI